VIVTISVEGVRVPAVNVTLTNVDGNVVIARTTSDAIGQVVFPDVSPGHYVVKGQRDGFADAESARFTIDSGEETEQVLLEMRLTFVRESIDVVVPANSPTESLQPVAVSDVLSGAKMDIQPLAGDDFQSLLLVLPSTIRLTMFSRRFIIISTIFSNTLLFSSAVLKDDCLKKFFNKLKWEGENMKILLLAINLISFIALSVKADEIDEMFAGGKNREFEFERFHETNVMEAIAHDAGIVCKDGLCTLNSVGTKYTEFSVDMSGGLGASTNNNSFGGFGGNYNINNNHLEPEDRTFASMNIKFLKGKCEQTVMVPRSLYYSINRYMYGLMNEDSTTRKSFTPADEAMIMFYTTISKNAGSCRK
jgi:hypothetical protein